MTARRRGKRSGFDDNDNSLLENAFKNYVTLPEKDTYNSASTMQQLTFSPTSSMSFGVDNSGMVELLPFKHIKYFFFVCR